MSSRPPLNHQFADNIARFRQAVGAITAQGLHPVSQGNWRQPAIDPDYREWKRIETNLRRFRLGRIGEPYSTVPQSFDSFMDHKMAYTRDKADDLMMAAAQEDLSRQVDALLDREPFEFDDMNIENNHEGLSTVLGQRTIWTSVSYDGPPVHELAPWPTPEECREEGDERHTSHFGRFLPIPRHCGNPTVNWKQKPFVIEEAFDRVLPCPQYKKMYPGLFYDHDGNPYDDPDQNGKTAYAVKNPFEPDLQVSEGAARRLNSRAELIANLNAGVPGGHRRQNHPVHPLADETQAATAFAKQIKAANLFLSLPLESPPALGEDGMEAMEMVPRSLPGRSLGNAFGQLHDLTPFSIIRNGHAFNFDPSVRDFIPLSPSEMWDAEHDCSPEDLVIEGLDCAESHKSEESTAPTGFSDGETRMLTMMDAKAEHRAYVNYAQEFNGYDLADADQLMALQ